MSEAAARERRSPRARAIILIIVALIATIAIVALATAQVIRARRPIVLEHPDWVRSLAFSPDGALLATGCNDGAVRIFSAHDGALVRKIDAGGKIASIAFSPDGSSLGIACDDALEITTIGGRSLRREPVNVPLDFVFTRDGLLLALARASVTIELRDARDLSIKDTLSPMTIDRRFVAMRCAACSPTDDLVAGGGDDGIVRLWGGRKLIRMFAEHHDNRVESLSFSAAGDLLASGGDDGVALVFRVQDGALVRKITHEGDSIKSVALSPDGERLIAGGFTRPPRLWCVRDGALLKTFDGPTLVSAVAFSPTDELVAIGGGDNKARLWPLR